LPRPFVVVNTRANGPLVDRSRTRRPQPARRDEARPVDLVLYDEVTLLRAVVNLLEARSVTD